jgi:hypothetical protein
VLLLHVSWLGMVAALVVAAGGLALGRQRRR